MQNIFLNYDSGKNLESITFYFANNEKSTVPASELPQNVIDLYVKESRIHNNSARKDRIYMSHQSFENLDEYTELHSPHLDDQIIKFETHKLFETALELIPEPQKWLIHEIYYKKTPAVELAKQLNVSKVAISRRLNRARNALKWQIHKLDPSYLPVS